MLVARTLYSIACACAVLLCHSANVVVRDRIVVAIDEYDGRYPTVRNGAVDLLLEVNRVKQPTKNELPLDSDVLVHAVWPVFYPMLQRSKSKFFKQYFMNRPEIMDMFERKAQWKEWMKSIGLGEYVPKSLVYENIDNLEYPVVLKVDIPKHAGRGVHIVHTAQQLNAMGTQLKKEKTPFFLEESLTGMGLAEMGTYSSAYQGKVLSMRCMQRDFSTETIQNDKINNKGFNTSHLEPFVKGPTLEHVDEYMLPCGQDVVKIVTDMMAHTNYTGIFCTNFKMDKHQNLRMMETNLRFCGTMRYTESLLVSSVVTLAHAILEANPDPAYRARSAILHGRHRDTFHRILHEEKRALATGGGYLNSTWITADKFDMKARLSPVLHTYDLPYPGWR